MTLAALAADALELSAGRRALIGLAGAPASGKSTLAEALAKAVPGAAIVAMDGFHLDDGILEARGLRPRKGAPETFDIEGFLALLDRVHAGPVFAPVFDRALELSRAAAAEIPGGERVIFVEGNYLLHNHGGWEHVRDRLDQCWFLDVPEPVLATRLAARWADLSAEEARRKIEANDLPNARLVADGKARADRVLTEAEIGIFTN